jgi:hypothetical protein
MRATCLALVLIIPEKYPGYCSLARLSLRLLKTKAALYSETSVIVYPIHCITSRNIVLFFMCSLQKKIIKRRHKKEVVSAACLSTCFISKTTGRIMITFIISEDCAHSRKGNSIFVHCVPCRPKTLFTWHSDCMLQHSAQPGQSRVHSERFCGLGCRPGTYFKNSDIKHKQASLYIYVDKHVTSAPRHFATSSLQRR